MLVNLKKFTPQTLQVKRLLLGGENVALINMFFPTLMLTYLNTVIRKQIPFHIISIRLHSRKKVQITTVNEIRYTGKRMWWKGGGWINRECTCCQRDVIPFLSRKCLVPPPSKSPLISTPLPTPLFWFLEQVPNWYQFEDCSPELILTHHRSWVRIFAF